MASVVASSVVYRGLETRSGKHTNYNISMCCFTAKHPQLNRKSKVEQARVGSK
jgi:hypothetical protein